MRPLDTEPKAPAGGDVRPHHHRDGCLASTESVSGTDRQKACSMAAALWAAEEALLHKADCCF